jgi:hypothetical protein
VYFFSSSNGVLYCIEMLHVTSPINTSSFDIREQKIENRIEKHRRPRKVKYDSPPPSHLHHCV